MKRFILACVFVLVSTAAFAQATPASKLAWDQPNATLAEASAMTYKFYPDGGATGFPLTGVTCVVGPPVSCSGNFPAFTPGSHTIQVTATNTAGESLKSTSFPFTFVVVPSSPTNLRIQ